TRSRRLIFASACAMHTPTSGRSLSALPTSPAADRKSTRLNSSHLVISYAVFCLKKKTRYHHEENYDYQLQTGPALFSSHEISPDPSTAHRTSRSSLTVHANPFVIPKICQV